MISIDPSFKVQFCVGWCKIARLVCGIHFSEYPTLQKGGRTVPKNASGMKFPCIFVYVVVYLS